MALLVRSGKDITMQCRAKYKSLLKEDEAKVIVKSDKVFTTILFLAFLDPFILNKINKHVNLLEVFQCKYTGCTPHKPTCLQN